MLLSQFFKNAPDIEIEQLSSDSRLPMRNAIFFCTRGVRYNGHNFIKEAVDNGAKVIVYDEDIDTSYPVIFIRVTDVADALARVASIYYENPSQEMENIIVGGNRTRSIMAYCTKEIVNTFRSCGYIGCYGIHYGDTHLLSVVPTLTILNNQRTLQMMQKESVLSCVFEMNYAAINFKKLSGIKTDAFAYSGTAADEREFADDEIGYITAYRRYVNDLKDGCDIVLCRDDANFARIASAIKRDFITFGLDENSSYYAKDIEVLKDKTRFTLVCAQDHYVVETPLCGRGGVNATLGVLAVLAERGYPLDEVISRLGNIVLPSGFEEKIDEGQNYRVMVDKASTLSDFENVLQYAKEITDARHKIVVVEGVGPQMDRRFRDGIAALLDRYVDQVIITENDCNDKDPMELGNDFASELHHARSVVIEDREDAIRAAIDLMNEDDMLLILGKGDEKTLFRSLGKEFYKGDSECAKAAIRLSRED